MVEFWEGACGTVQAGIANVLSEQPGVENVVTVPLRPDRVAVLSFALLISLQLQWIRTARLETLCPTSRDPHPLITGLYPPGFQSCINEQEHLSHTHQDSMWTQSGADQCPGR